jgi:signal transduction histidine kinase
MAGHKRRSRYESEVHLGFLAIACLLVFLNFVSNYVLHRALSAQREETLARLRRTAVLASREIQLRYPEITDSTSLRSFGERAGLSEIILLPVKPQDSSFQSKRDWFREVARQYPPYQNPSLADKLYRAEVGELTQGEGPEFYYLYPIPGETGSGLLVLTIDSPDLAYLSDSQKTLVLVLAGALVVMVAVYMLLSRFMFRPFRRIREQVEQAGRELPGDEDETEAVVEEYERAIRQLTATKTELLRLNEEIQKRADTLEMINRGLTETSLLGIVTLDLEGRIVAINDTALRLLEIEPGRYTGERLVELLSGRGALRDTIEQVTRDENGRGYREFSDLGLSRSEAVLGVTITDIREPDRGVTGLLLMISDQSEIGRLRKELEHRQRLAALGELAGGLAHQMRNSLGSISGYATLVKKRLQHHELPTEGIETLLDETRTAGELIGRFLTFARPLDFAPRTLNLNELTAECLDSFRVRPEYSRFEFIVRQGSEITLEADPVLLKQALANLVDNAAKAYGPDGGTIEVFIAAKRGQAVLAVRDFGCGIAAENLDKIFTPFYSSRPSGTGLGLSLVAKIVALHAGTVDVKSGPGAGTCFEIRLPLSLRKESILTQSKEIVPA